MGAHDLDTAYMGVTLDASKHVPGGWDNGETRPYGVAVGDRVFYWPENPPPLSEGYVAPECHPALVLRLYSSPRSIWAADLAIAEPDGEGGATVRIRTGVEQMESSASMYGSRSYGTLRGGSWHRKIVHASERAG